MIQLAVMMLSLILTRAGTLYLTIYDIDKKVFVGGEFFGSVFPWKNSLIASMKVVPQSDPRPTMRNKAIFYPSSSFLTQDLRLSTIQMGSLEVGSDGILSGIKDLPEWAEITDERNIEISFRVKSCLYGDKKMPINYWYMITSRGSVGLFEGWKEFKQALGIRQTPPAALPAAAAEPPLSAETAASDAKPEAESDAKAATSARAAESTPRGNPDRLVSFECTSDKEFKVFFRLEKLLGEVLVVPFEIDDHQSLGDRECKAYSFKIKNTSEITDTLRKLKTATLTGKEEDNILFETKRTLLDVLFYKAGHTAFEQLPNFDQLTQNCSPKLRRELTRSLGRTVTFMIPDFQKGRKKGSVHVPTDFEVNVTYAVTVNGRRRIMERLLRYENHYSSGAEGHPPKDPSYSA